MHNIREASGRRSSARRLEKMHALAMLCASSPALLHAPTMASGGCARMASSPVMQLHHQQNNDNYNGGRPQTAAERIRARAREADRASIYPTRDASPPVAAGTTYATRDSSPPVAAPHRGVVELVQGPGAPLRPRSTTSSTTPPPIPKAPEPPPVITVQGGALRTWTYRSPSVEQVQVVLTTEGRPLDAECELWAGPGNVPVKMRVFVEDGQLRPFSCVLATPRGEKTVAIRNVGQLEFPFNAQCIAEDVDHPSEDC